jgi:hypothetical protein
MASFYPLTGCLFKAGLDKTALAGSHLRLFVQGFTPSITSSLQDCIDNECDYDGYAPLTITAFNDPGFDTAGGASISSPLVQFVSTPASPSKTNNVGGWFLVSTGSPGTLVAVGTYPSPGMPMGLAGQVLPIVVKLLEATGV